MIVKIIMVISILILILIIVTIMISNEDMQISFLSSSNLIGGYCQNCRLSGPLVSSAAATHT